MSKRLANKTIAITGAGRGIGRAYALAMAAEGANIIVNDIGVDSFGEGGSLSPADEVAAEITAQGGTAIANYADISDYNAAGTLVSMAVDNFGKLDGLVNNASIEHRKSLQEHEPKAWAKVLSVNATGTFNCVQHAIPVMRSQRSGAIINTTSGAFWEGTPGVAAYSASKAAVFSLTLSQHQELFEYGIRSNCIAPNATETRMVESWIQQLSENSNDGREAILKEWGIQTPDNLAPLAIALCSDEAAKVSGHILEVWSDKINVVQAPQRGSSIERDGEQWDTTQLLNKLSLLSG